MPNISIPGIGGQRSYTWTKNQLQEAKVVTKAPQRGAHRRRRERASLPGMMLHQDGSTHEWVPGKKWDLIDTLDDATSEHYMLRPRLFEPKSLKLSGCNFRHYGGVPFLLNQRVRLGIPHSNRFN